MKNPTTVTAIHRNNPAQESYTSRINKTLKEANIEFRWETTKRGALNILKVSWDDFSNAHELVLNLSLR